MEKTLEIELTEIRPKVLATALKFFRVSRLDGDPEDVVQDVLLRLWAFDNAPDGRKIALAWMSNWQYANQVPTKQFRSANSVPRDLGLFEYNGDIYCSVTPSKELDAIRGKAVSKLQKACEIVVDTKGSTEIVLSNSLGEQVVMKYDAGKKTFSMDRTRSYASFSEAFPAVTVSPTYGDIRQMRIFVDNSSIEAFDADGKMAMTNLVFPSEPYNTMKVKGGKATIYEIKK